MYDVDYNNLVNLNAYFKNTVLPTIAIAQGDILNHGISNSYLPWGETNSIDYIIRCLSDYHRLKFPGEQPPIWTPQHVNEFKAIVQEAMNLNEQREAAYRSSNLISWANSQVQSGVFR